MSTPTLQHTGPWALRRLRFLTASGLALAVSAGMVAPAYADIDNTATAKGTAPGGAADGITDTDTESVLVAPFAPQLTVLKTAGTFVDVGPSPDGVIKGGDTIEFTINIKNDGNVSMFNVVPVETGGSNGITFAGVAGTGSFGSFSPATATIAPGDDVDFTVTYTLTDEDAFRAAGTTDAVDNTASATGNIGASGGAVIGSGFVTPDTVETTLPSNPLMTITKSYTLVKGPGNSVAGQAEVGDTINYLYTVFNAGNRTLTDVKVDDEHEGTTLSNSPTRTVNNETLLTDGALANSSDAPVAPLDGIYTTLGAGGTVTFTYAHTVTVTEFNNQ